MWSAGILAHTFITGKDTLRTGLLANVKVDLHRAFHVKQKPISERLLRKTCGLMALCSCAGETPNVSPRTNSQQALASHLTPKLSTITLQ